MIFARYQGNKPGFNIKLVQPIMNRLAFTAQLGYNENYIAQNGNLTDCASACSSAAFSIPRTSLKSTSATDGCPADPLRDRHSPRGLQPTDRGCRSDQLNIQPAIVT